jgi:SAM-dependent methyltransferase
MPTVLEAISPEPMRRQLADLCAADAETQVLSYLLESPDRLLMWAHSLGVVSNRSLRAAASPVPPRELRALGGPPDEPPFLWTGLVDILTFLGIYARLASPPPGRKPRMLDFGCASGRLTRYLDMHEGVEAFGVDASPAAVEWCQLNLARVLTLLQAGRQKLPFGDGLFDLVYANKLFAEVAPRRMRQCFDEITRVMVPGGLLLAVTLGPTALAGTRGSASLQAAWHIDAARADEINDMLLKEGRVHLPSYAGENEPDDRDGPTFIDPGYPRSHWNSDAFTVLECIPGGLRNCQDIVVLRRE